jgi:hypothetical protein
MSIRERDYMKRPSEDHDEDRSDHEVHSVDRLDPFAGLQREKLSVETSLPKASGSELPTISLGVCQPKNQSAPTDHNSSARSDEIISAKPYRLAGYAAIALAILILGILIGITLFK